MVYGKIEIDFLRKMEKAIGKSIRLEIKPLDEAFEVEENEEIPPNFKFSLIDETFIRNYKANQIVKSTEVINSRFFNRDYTEILEDNDTLFICSNMGTGKSVGLRNLIDKNKSILVITYRCSLSKTFCDKFNLTSYIDIKSSMISCPRLSCQIDSLWRVSGDYDLFVLDEVSYMLEHMVSFVKEKRLVDDNLDRLLKSAEKVIVLDAILRQRHIDIINGYREREKYFVLKNETKVYSDYSCEYVAGKKKQFINYVLERLDKGKRLIIPSNSKIVLKDLKNVITEKFEKLKVGYIDSDSEFIEVERWGDYDVLLYSPTIEAGLSFDEEWFDEEVCYCNNWTNSPRSFSQMMFRNRKLKDKKIVIFGSLERFVYRPLNEDEMIREIKGLSRPFKDLGLNVSDLSNRKLKSDYYKRFIQLSIGINVERVTFKATLKEILQDHGIEWKEEAEKFADLVFIENEVMNEVIEKGREEEAESIIKARSLGFDEFDILKKKKKLTIEETKSMKKYLFTTVFEIQDVKLTAEMYRDLSPYISQCITQNNLKRDGVAYYERNAREISEKSEDLLG